MSALRLAALVSALALAVASGARAQSPPVTPADFAAAAAGADAYEIMAAHVALTESKSAPVRAFADQMAREHASAVAALRQAAIAAGLTPPPSGVGADQAALLAALQGLRGDDFDRAYARQQVLAHRQALATEGGYAREGANMQLRAAARADLPMIERHLRQAEGLSARFAR